MSRKLPWLPVIAAALVSCGTSTDPESASDSAEPASEFGPTGIPKHMRAATGPDGSRVAAGGNLLKQPGLHSVPLNEIAFTDPDNPDKPLPELNDVMELGKAKSWENSDTIARARAAREGKPVLIWFTDSQSSPLCKALNQELFSSPKFEEWANEKLVRLKVDASFRARDKDLSIDEAQTLELDAKHYREALKKRYKVLGHPTLIMLKPSGEVLARYAGYKRGTSETLWGQLKHSESVSTRAYQEWRAGLEKKGYRDWRDPKDRKIFAKLVSYQNGELVLIDPDGTRFRTSEAKLSDADQQWIAAQKQLGNIR
ncbi:MAG: thioredoxin family protein [Verrucomicrobia bacterium]|nr:thioredoxin family protein [Verrucomicrobiota bacterium]